MSAMIEAPPDAPVMLKVSEAVRQFGVSKAKLYDLIHEGKIDARLHGNTWLIVYASLLRWVNSLETADV